MVTSPREKRAAFRQLHEDGFFVLPNVWDAGGAIRCARAGFRAVASTSAGAALALGRGDGQLSLDETLAHLTMLVDSSGLPVNADFEAGFADHPEELARNVERAVATGVAGLSIEDWSGTEVYARNAAVERLLAARTAIDEVDASVMLIGQHEHFREPDLPLKESIERAAAYASAGADCVFVPFIIEPAAIADLVAAVAPVPLSVVVHDYDDTILEMAALGVRRCSVGGSLAKRVWTSFDLATDTLLRLENRARSGTSDGEHAADRQSPPT